MNKSRFEAFSDGVFAFAITVLVLGLALPAFTGAHPSDAELTHALLGLWPNLIAYVLSFAVIGIMWQNHHALFRLVHTVDRMTVFLNLLLLGVTVFIPFATSTLGAYPTMRSSTFLYGLTLTCASTAYNLLVMHLVRKDAFSPGASRALIRQTIVAYRIGWVTYVLATIIALAAPVVSFALYMLIAGYYLIPHGADSDAVSASSR